MLENFAKELWNSSKLLNVISIIFFMGSIFYGLVFISSWVFSQHPFALKSVIVDVRSTGKSNVSPREVKSIVLQSLNGTALTTELKVLFDSLSANQWVEHLVIRRIWPNKLLVIIREHRVIATWNSKKFLSSSGRVLDLLDVNKEHLERNLGCSLVSLEGPNETHNRVLIRATEINEKLQSHGLGLSRLSLSGVYTWEAETLDQTIIKFGGDKIVTPVSNRMDNFLASLEWLKKRRLDIGRGEHINLVDLRYAKGFAFEVRAENGSKKFIKKNAFGTMKQDDSCLRQLEAYGDLV